MSDHEQALARSQARQLSLGFHQRRCRYHSSCHLRRRLLGGQAGREAHEASAGSPASPRWDRASPRRWVAEARGQVRTRLMVAATW